MIAYRYHVEFKDDRSIEPRSIRRAIRGGASFPYSGSIIDVFFQDDGRTHAGRSRENCGGVGRNIANALINLGLNATRLISVVGNDQPGKAIIKSLGDGAQTVEQLSNMNTARYALLFPANFPRMLDHRLLCLILNYLDNYKLFSFSLID